MCPARAHRPVEEEFGGGGGTSLASGGSGHSGLFREAPSAGRRLGSSQVARCPRGHHVPHTALPHAGSPGPSLLFLEAPPPAFHASPPSPPPSSSKNGIENRHACDSAP